MKITYLHRPERVAETSLWFYFPTGVFKDLLRTMHCWHRFRPTGKDAAGRTKRARFCKNEAKYAKYVGDQEWETPLCTIHYRKRSDG